VHKTLQGSCGVAGCCARLQVELGKKQIQREAEKKYFFLSGLEIKNFTCNRATVHKNKKIYIVDTYNSDFVVQVK
jgi:hypothetical protein